ncbi:MAG: Unknown protein [uncultured Sulfurovum sp.]|uniref:RNA polymerase sigma-70 region 4 domain-containing protein n=1 Tax=uncultured Sulfurovum sp. TaxID=269237 RepID=A0A6S6T094_9BACT|nr:MAG: Unknown protein [uncultured Sulfurovum sp.]
MKKLENKYINEAYAYLEKWAPFFTLDEDDKQDIIFKFYKYYKPGKTPVNGFVNMLCKQLKQEKYFKQGKKRKHNGTNSIDANETTDWINYLIDDGVFKIDEEELLNERKVLIQYYMSVLTDKEKLMIDKYYLQGFNQNELAVEYGCTSQNISEIIRKGIKKIKNNIK